MKICRKKPLATVLFGALSASLPVMLNAQTVDAKNNPSSDADQIVVTAQKVAQPSFKVGASLAAIGADDIRDKGVTDAKSLTDLIPNTQISQGGGSNVVVNIRGIDNTNTTPLGEPAAAFHIDGVYLGRMSGAGSAFYDIERVEVLRGPQGTLYGRNANAGVVNVITKAPSDKLEGNVAVDVGNLGQKRVDGAFNLPVNDALSLRFAASSNRRDGFSETKTATNGFTENRDNINTDSIRLSGLVKISSKTSLSLSYDESTNRGAGPNYYDLTSKVIPTQNLVDPNNSLQGRFDDNASGWRAELKTDVGFANLNYIYGNRTTKMNEDYSVGILGLLTDNKVAQETHELRLSSNNNSPLQWVGGLFKFNEKTTDNRLDGIFPVPGPLSGAACGGLASCTGVLQYLDNSIASDSTAVFGQVTYSMTNADRLIVGARHTSDEKSRTGQQLFSFDGTFNTAGNFVAPLYGAGKWERSTYKLGYEKDISPTQMYYAGVATGFKSGGFNDGDTRTSPQLVYKPEEITSYEMGLNGKFFDNALQLTSSVFHYDYTEMQKTGIVNNSAVTVNLGKASVNGVEVSARYRLHKSGTVNASLGLLDAKYDSYTSPNGTDFSGKNLDKSPTLTLNLGYTHNWNLESGARITGYIGTKYSSSYNLTDVGTATTAPIVFEQGSFTKSNLSITYADSTDAIDVQFYVKNIENNSQLMGTTSLAGTNYGYMSEPRTFGVRSTFRF